VYHTAWVIRYRGDPALAIAGQDVDLVEGTVIENVRTAKNDASEEEVLEALRWAGISEIVEALPINTTPG
jgi:ABC-type multidrug transport system fused ATPase/permease subunit